MKNNKQQNKDNSSKARKKLKKYSKPEFRSYGTIKAMTMGLLSQPQLDSGGSMFFNT